MAFILPTYKAPANTLREYTGSGTWNKPTNPSFKGVWVFAVGGGGSGGAGVASLSALNGGSGGSGATFVRRWIPSAALSSSVSVTVGAGAPGAATTAGTSGSSTLFGSYILAVGGNGGQVGANPTRVVAAGGSALSCIPILGGYSFGGGNSGNGVSTVVGTAAQNGMFTLAAPGGGGGGGSDATIAGPGTAGGGVDVEGALTAGGAAGALGLPGTAGVNDVNLDPFLGLVTSTIGIGTGGGGGGGNRGNNQVAGNGAAGGRGAGGGGGGSVGQSTGGVLGTSGAGGDGFIIIYEVY